ncbi:CotO family spore coat protein [Bacillus licheniformis]|nr:CotO family spore coat protein [Bacillus licheniformis]
MNRSEGSRCLAETRCGAKPLMYIVQPDYDKAEANMQDILIKERRKQSPKLPNKSAAEGTAG